MKKLGKLICRVQFATHADSPIVPKQFLLSCAGNLDVGPVYASQIKKLRKRVCRVEPAPLWASSYTHYLLYKRSRPIQRMQTVQLFQNIFLLSCAVSLNVAPVSASQIKKLRKRICRVKPAPLWASSYTHYLLYKAQDPFSACRQFSCSEAFFLSCTGNLDVGPVYSLQIKNHRIFGCIFDSLERLFLTLITSYCCDQFCQTSLCLREQKIQGLSER